jgi:hypothetical protein
MSLPEEQKSDIANIANNYSKIDGPYIRSVKGFARKSSSTSSGILPWGIVLVDYDGENRVINRTALRKAIGNQRAESEINNFLVQIGEDPEQSRSERLRLRLENTKSQLRLEEKKERGLSGRDLHRKNRRGYNTLDDTDSCSSKSVDFDASSGLSVPNYSYQRKPRRKGDKRNNAREDNKLEYQEDNKLREEVKDLREMMEQLMLQIGGAKNPR